MFLLHPQIKKKALQSIPMCCTCLEALLCPSSNWIAAYIRTYVHTHIHTLCKQRDSWSLKAKMSDLVTWQQPDNEAQSRWSRPVISRCIPPVHSGIVPLTSCLADTLLNWLSLTVLLWFISRTVLSKGLETCRQQSQYGGTCYRSDVEIWSSAESEKPEPAEAWTNRWSKNQSNWKCTYSHNDTSTSLNQGMTKWSECVLSINIQSIKKEKKALLAIIIFTLL